MICRWQQTINHSKLAHARVEQRIWFGLQIMQFERIVAINLLITSWEQMDLYLISCLPTCMVGAK